MCIVVSGLTDFDNVLFHREVKVKDDDGKQSKDKQGVEKRMVSVFFLVEFELIVVHR